MFYICSTANIKITYKYIYTVNFTIHVQKLKIKDNMNENVNKILILT